MAIGTMTIERNTPRAGSTELSSTAMPRPIAIDTGVTMSVNSAVLRVERQNSPSENNRT